MQRYKNQPIPARKYSIFSLSGGVNSQFFTIVTGQAVTMTDVEIVKKKEKAITTSPHTATASCKGCAVAVWGLAVIPIIIYARVGGAYCAVAVALKAVTSTQGCVPRVSSSLNDTSISRLSPGISAK